MTLRLSYPYTFARQDDALFNTGLNHSIDQVWIQGAPFPRSPGDQRLD
jgi:hypothetical protein